MADITLSAKSGMSPVAQLYAGTVPLGDAIAMAELAGTGEFLADLPPGVAAGQYLVIFFEGNTKLTSGTLRWDGVQEVSAASEAALASSQAAILASVGAIPTGLTAAQVREELAPELARMDAPVSTRLAAADYTAPANTDIAAIKAKTDTLTNAPTLQDIEASTVLAKAGDTLSANIVQVNGVAVTGTGEEGAEWGPAA